ncbi:MAG: hypothetical protein GY775_16005 [Candidatus Scalindua sp.]|nr:hypothetical protein [Candidatus Scalindua sp.]
MRPNRQSHRLKGYDYSRNGAYFITIVCQDRINRFGEIVNGSMVLNDAGRMVREVWNSTMNEFQHIHSDEFIIMPNHFHAIIVIVGADSISARSNDSISVRNVNSMPHRNVDSNDIVLSRAEMDSAPTGRPTVGTVVQSFKRHSTVRYINGVKLKLVPPFRKRLWQRDYYDHIIRNKSEYETLREYIFNNPLSWEFDTLKAHLSPEINVTLKSLK